MWEREREREWLHAATIYPIDLFAVCIERTGTHWSLKHTHRSIINNNNNNNSTLAQWHIRESARANTHTHTPSYSNRIYIYMALDLVSINKQNRIIQYWSFSVRPCPFRWYRLQSKQTHNRTNATTNGQ